MVSTTTIVLIGVSALVVALVITVVVIGVVGYQRGWFTTSDLPEPKGELNISSGPYPVANGGPSVVNGVTGEFVDATVKLGSTATADDIYARYGYRLVAGSVTSPAVNIAPTKKSKTVWQDKVYTRSLSNVLLEPTFRVNLFKFQIPAQAAGPLTSGLNSYQLIASYFSDAAGKVRIPDMKDLPIAQIIADTTAPVYLLESEDVTYNKIFKA